MIGKEERGKGRDGAPLGEGKWTLPGSVHSEGSNGESQTELKAWTGTATDSASGKPQDEVRWYQKQAAHECWATPRLAMNSPDRMPDTW